MPADRAQANQLVVVKGTQSDPYLCETLLPEDVGKAGSRMASRQNGFRGQT